MLRREDGGGQEDDLEVLLPEVVGVIIEGDVGLGGNKGIVGAGVGEDGVALGEEGLGEELARVAEAEDSDLHGGLVEVGLELGLVVVRPGGIVGSDVEGLLAVEEIGWWRRERERERRRERVNGGGGEIGRGRDGGREGMEGEQGLVGGESQFHLAAQEPDRQSSPIPGPSYITYAGPLKLKRKSLHCREASSR